MRSNPRSIRVTTWMGAILILLVGGILLFVVLQSVGSLRVIAQESQDRATVNTQD